MSRTRSRTTTKTPTPPARTAVLYVRVSSKEQEQGFSIPAQRKLLAEYARLHGLNVLREFEDVETAKRAGRTAFTEMVEFLTATKDPQPILLVEKTDRLYRNIKDWVTIDGLGIEVHLVKEGVVLSQDSRSSEKFMHGIRVLMGPTFGGFLIANVFWVPWSVVSDALASRVGTRRRHAAVSPATTDR